MRKAMGELARRVDTRWSRTPDTVLLFNSTPWARRSVERIPMSFEPCRARGVRLFDAERRPVDSQSIVRERWDDGSIRSLELLASPMVPGLGYKAFSAELSDQEHAAPAQAAECGTFENPWMRVVIQGDGTFSSLVHARTGTELLAAGARGNEMRMRLGEEGQWLSSRRDGASAAWSRGSLADGVRVEGQMGPILFSEDILLYHDRGRMDFLLTLDFGSEGIALGNFWDDHTKLNVYWPFAIPGNWRHDIPFGSIPARERRPLYCTNWIDLSNDDLGVTYYNMGTTKHWVEGNVLANVLAWGGNWFSNRHPGIWEYVKKYDLRLFGRHTIEASLCVHDGDWRQAAPHRIAEERANPLAACWDTPHAGPLPAAKGLMEIRSPHIGMSAVLRSGAPGGIACRLYEAQGKEVDLAGLRIDSSLKMHSVRNLTGERVRWIGPFAIVELDMEAGSMGGEKVRMLLDTDIGSDVDDAMALCFALRSPEIALEGVTTVYGDVQLRARIASKLIALSGGGDIPCVRASGGLCCGAARPLDGSRGRGHPDGRGPRLGERGGCRGFHRGQGKGEQGQARIAAIGPLTNIAAAIILAPEIVEQVKELIFIGGVARLGDNSLEVPALEWNVKCDPEAARVVFTSGIPLTMLGMDVTRRAETRMDQSHWSE